MAAKISPRGAKSKAGSNSKPKAKSPRHTRKKTARKAAPSKAAKPRAVDSGASKRAPASAPTDLVGIQVRIQKLLAAAGFGSRRKCEELISQGRIFVNGKVAKLGDTADPGSDDIRFDGERLVGDKPVYWVVHKPEGVITSSRDPEGRATIHSLMPPKGPRMFPVGRLDLGTSGLVLMTNDGDMTQRLLHPSLGNEREYRVTSKGCVSEKAFLRLRAGIHLEDGKTNKTEVSAIRYDPKTDTTMFTLMLKEGRKRQIRRSMLILKFPVKKLVRVRMGPLHLGRLPRGAARPLRDEEISELRGHVAGLVKSPTPRKKRPVRRYTSKPR